MFTKNFINLQMVEPFLQSGGNYTIDGKGFKSPINATNLVGLWSNYYSLHEKIVSTLCTSMATNKYGVVFGSDGTPETEDDYTFANGFISGISLTVSKSSGVKESLGGVIEREYVIVNNNSAEITIREVGIWWKGVLLERTVLDTPVTIAPSEAGGVKYTLRFNYRLFPT